MNKLHISTSLVVGLVIGALAMKWWSGRAKKPTAPSEPHGFILDESENSTGVYNATGAAVRTRTFGSSGVFTKLGDKDKHNKKFQELKKQGLRE